jgi:hypothetical protein
MCLQIFNVEGGFGFRHGLSPIGEVARDHAK